MSLLKQMVRYQPTDRDAGTRVTWDVGDGIFECYHEESDTYMYLNISEIPTMIKVFQEIHDLAQPGVEDKGNTSDK